MSFYHTVEMPLGQFAPGVFVVNKKRGETLKALLDRVRNDYCIDSDVSMTYAGRLDPMAEGLVIVLTGEKCKEKEQYLGLDKTYQFEVLLGIATDTADTLGLITRSTLGVEQKVYSDDVILPAIANLQGDIEIVYPMYSSKTVDGKPLFSYARAGQMPPVIPTKKGIVKAIAVQRIRTVQLSTLIEEIVADISRVEGDFRQSDIAQTWKEVGSVDGNRLVTLITCTAMVTSGVYIRSLAEMIGAQLGAPALAYSIKRIAIGTQQS